MSIQIHDILIPTSCIDEEKLKRFADSAAKATGKTYMLDSCYRLTTSDAELAGYLEVFKAAAMVDGPTVSAKTNAHKPAAAKPRKAKVAKTVMGSKSWKRLDTGEIDSAQAWKKSIRAGRIPIETRFENAKGEYIVVLQGDNGLEPIKEPKP